VENDNITDMIFTAFFSSFGRRRIALYGDSILAYFIYGIFWNIYNKNTIITFLALCWRFTLL
jgi:hypothetical protein